MKELFMIIWLLPILFMVHDFEEIIIIKSWQQKNKESIENRLQKFVPFNFKASTAAFSIGVAEEFVIISIVTLISYLFNNYIAWFSLFIAFALHLFFHAIMWMIFKKYVPGVVTSVIFIPLCCFMAYRVNMLLHYNSTTLLFSILIGTLIMMVNIYFLHKVMGKFDFWLEKYSFNSIKTYLVKKSQFNDWEYVFANPTSIKIETLKTGIIVSKMSGLLNLKNINASELKDGIADIPVLAHIIRHEKYGNYLIDTGFDSSFADEAGGNFKGILKKLYFKNLYIQEKRSDGVEVQLKEKGINLNGVFLTHIHEHASGSPSLPNEIPYVYGDGERETSFFPLVYSNFLKNKTNLQKINFSMGESMDILEKCVDIFGDGSLLAVSTKGHTKGHISYIVNGKETQTFVTGDACISKKGLELGVETGKYSSDIKEGRKSFLKIKEFIKQYPHLKIIFGHETDEFKIEYR